MTHLTNLPLTSLRIDGGTQARESINNDTVANYAEAINDGAEFPPVIVYFDGADNWLAGGFHRYHSHKRAGRVEIACEVRQGTLREAVEFACGDNAHHGLPRTNADKRKAVSMLLALPEWTDRSDREVAKKIGVTHMLVAAVRDPGAAQRQQEKRDASARKRLASDATPVAHPVASDATPTAPRPVVTDAGAAVWPAAGALDQPAPTERDRIAEEAHGDTDVVTLLEETQRNLESALKRIDSLSADDTKAELDKMVRRAEHAERRQGELMDNAAKSQERERWTMNQLRRCGKAVGEDDPAKVAATVEAFVRSMKVAA